MLNITPSAVVRAARARGGLTQRELAAAAGTAQPVVARVESGQVSPTVDTLERLVRAAGFEVRWDLRPAAPADPVIAAYKRDIDRSLLRENLRKSPEDRVRALQALGRLAGEARRAGGKVSGTRKR